MTLSNCERARKKLMFPERYRCVSKMVKVKKVNMSGFDLCFSIPSKDMPFDANIGDRIASVCPSDFEEQVETFRKSGYSDDEIKEIYDALYYSKRHGHGYNSLELPKQVKVEVTWLEHHW